ncbi:hypothetical protein [Pseudomonas vranovensis]|uniref:hypothetical protein n=1 Tax=Pseudomonas vranovensis TaxID=321661 RepID=UPI003D968676
MSNATQANLPQHSAVTSKSLAQATQGTFNIPLIGELAAFTYQDAVKFPSLLLDDANSAYVYILRRTDKLDTEHNAPQPFYVGKGIKRRYAFHYYEAATTAKYAPSKNMRKIHTINKVGRDKVLIQIIPCHSSEYANDLEIKLIAHWGRSSNNSGCLTNLTDGGEGVSGLQMPEHVLELLREKARQPVLFNGKKYAGIKVAFQAHSPLEIANALEVDIESGYCTDYNTFKAWYHNWAKQGFFPEGFNYLDEDRPVYMENSRALIQEQTQANRMEGYKKAWNTRYAYPRYWVRGNAYHTISEAAAKESVGTESNLAALFRRMVSSNLFYQGYNLLDASGNKLFQESQQGLLDVARLKNAEFLIDLVSKPVLLNGILYENRMSAFGQSSHSENITYFAFTSQINRYIKAGVFPHGLNVPDASGAPTYPEIDPFLLRGRTLQHYYKVCNRLFPSMQSASLFYGLSHSVIHRYFTTWKKEAESAANPLAFPTGFNIYDSKTQQSLYPEMEIVDCRVPASGYLYLGKKFATLAQIDTYRKRARGVTSTLCQKRRKAYFETQAPLDSTLNVLGLDGTPLYPVDLSLKISTPIAAADGNGHRLHNAAKPVWIYHDSGWTRFDSHSAAYRALRCLQQKYKNEDSFTASIASQVKAGRRPDWLSLTDPEC